MAHVAQVASTISTLDNFFSIQKGNPVHVNCKVFAALAEKLKKQSTI